MDLFEVIIGVAIMIFWMLGGIAKSQKKGRPTASSAGIAQPQRVVRREPQLSETERLIREALGIVEDRGNSGVSILPVRDEMPDQLTDSTEAAADLVEEDYGQPAEAEPGVEPAAAAHDQFHEMYLGARLPAPTVRRTPTIRGVELKSAIIAREILGPPKALQND